MAMRLGGNGKKRKSYADNNEMNVTPFVDVMLVLLIIFMVAAPLATVNIKVDLPPPTDTPQEVVKETNIFISLQESGAIFIGDGQSEDKEVPLDKLPEAMEEISKGNKGTRVFIRADQEVIYNNVMQMMNLVKRTGYEKVGIVVEEVVD
jgi:TonB system transport protein ExbD (group 1)